MTVAVTLSRYLPYVASINLDTGAYYAMENAPEVCDALPAYGEYDALLEAACGVFHPSDTGTIRERFSMARLLKVASSNGQSIHCEARHKTKDGVWRWAWLACVFGPEESNGLPHAYLLVRPYEDEHNAAQERLGLEKVFELAVQTVFEYICLLDPEDGSYVVFGNDGQNTHHVPERGDYDQMVCAIRDELVLEEDKKAFFQQAVMENVVERLKKGDGRYSYLYRTRDGMRKASFYYYNADRTGILLTVQRKSVDAAPQSGESGKI